MPNWCNNSITISGSTETLETLWEEANKEDSGLLQAMVPMPKALHDTTSPCEPDEALQEKYGASNWYDWAVRNWGTKWDVSLEGLDFHNNHDGTSTIEGWFDSAWGPPIEAYNTFLDDMDGCSIEATYEEGGMDFAGHYDNGSDDYIEGISDFARKKIKDGDSGSTLYDFLDDELELTENRREYIEEELEEETSN